MHIAGMKTKHEGKLHLGLGRRNYRAGGMCLLFSMMLGSSASLAANARQAEDDAYRNSHAGDGVVYSARPARGKESKSKHTSEPVKIAANKKDKSADKPDKKEKSKSKTEKQPKTIKQSEGNDLSSTAAMDDKSKPGGGFFGFGGKKKGIEKEEPVNSSSGTQTGKVENARSTEDPNAPEWKSDPALVSVLRDVSKSLKDSEAVQKLEDAGEKLVARLAGEVLEKAVNGCAVQPNRIVNDKERAKAERTMTAEAWESGDVQVSPQLRASVVALWAKKNDGLLTVSIVGDYSGAVPGTEGPLGEFIAVIYAQSAIDKGFDIQSQQEVNYWICKVSDLKIDRGSAAIGERKSYYRLQAPITARKREFLEVAACYQEEKKQLALRAEEERKRAEESKAADKLTEAIARSMAEALAKVGKTTDAATRNGGGSDGEKKPEGATANQLAHSTIPTSTGATTISSSQLEQLPPTSTPLAQTQTAAGFSAAMIQPEPGRTSRAAWESPAPVNPSRPPSSSANLVYPARALAGQFITVSVVGAGAAAEPFVDVNFNGANVPSSEAGRVIYQVPDDATPGFSLHMNLAARSGQTPAAVNVLQPLTRPVGTEVPKIDGLSPVVGGRGFMIIDGHNFDGLADRNRVIIDGVNDAIVLASSPVQIVAKIPGNLSPGLHTASVSTAGLRSNPGQFEFVTVEVNSVGPDNAKNELRKLSVRVQGTQNKVRVKLMNQSPDVIHLLKGNEVVVVTSGGVNNSAVVPAQRLRPGSYRIETEVVM